MITLRVCNTRYNSVTILFGTLCYYRVVGSIVVVVIVTG